MTNPEKKGNCAVIFGGTGFIGVFFAAHLLSTGRYSKIYLYDLQTVDEKPFQYRKELVSSLGAGVVQIVGDVRDEITWRPIECVDLVANFAAIHREPGHRQVEYFETNLKGAENVTKWVEVLGCSNLIFTSSISPYGVSEAVKDESTLPVPVSAYGASKLVAEKIHQIWQARDAGHRRLVIVRPGVVFGPGEGGNVTRLVKAVRKGYFFYMGNKNTRKAGIYVKELCNAIWYVYTHQLKNGECVSLFNGSMNPGPSISEYVEATKRISGVRRSVPSIPFRLLLFISHLIELIAKPLGISHPFSPVRIWKLVRSNNIAPNYLVRHGYSYKYDIDSAMLDWKSSGSGDWN